MENFTVLYADRYNIWVNLGTNFGHSGQGYGFSCVSFLSSFDADHKLELLGQDLMPRLG